MHITEYALNLAIKTFDLENNFVLLELFYHMYKLN